MVLSVINCKMVGIVTMGLSYHWVDGDDVDAPSRHKAGLVFLMLLNRYSTNSLWTLIWIKIWQEYTTFLLRYSGNKLILKSIMQEGCQKMGKDGIMAARL